MKTPMPLAKHRISFPFVPRPPAPLIISLDGKKGRLYSAEIGPGPGSMP